jgi:hypothetical protein
MKCELSVESFSDKSRRVNTVQACGAQLMAQKSAVKSISTSSRVQPREGKSQFAFVPSDASVKVCRWPKF